MRYTTSGQKAMEDGDLDYRYTIRVFLIRDGRSKYWEFHCPYCGAKVCELNGEIVYMTDITHDSTKAVNRVRCNGKYCKNWYEFSLS